MPSSSPIQATVPNALAERLFRCGNNALVLPASYVIQSALEMPPRVLKRRGIFVGLKVGMDEFDEAIEVFRCYLCRLVSEILLVPDEQNLQPRSPGRSSTRNGSISRQRAQQTQPHPCRHPQLEVRAASTRVLAYHRDRAGKIRLRTGAEAGNSHSWDPPRRAPGSR